MTRRQTMRATGWLVLLALAVGGAELARRLGVPVENLLKDPTAANGTSSFRGALSNLGLFGWSAAVTVLLLAAWLRPSPRRPFLVGSAAGILLLGLDDAWLLHEKAAERYLGLPDGLLLVIYAVLGLVWLIRFSSDIAPTGVVDLGAAAIGFGLSAFIDLTEIAHSAEDVCKYVGLLALVVWAVDVARHELGRVEARPPTLTG